MTESTPNYNAMDVLKFAAAQSRFAWEKAAQLLDSTKPAEGAALLLIGRLNGLLHANLFALSSPNDPATYRYSNGRMTQSEVELEPGGDVWHHIWHPDPNHPGDRPGTVVAESRVESGAVKRLVITAPGFIDVVTSTAADE